MDWHLADGTALKVSQATEYPWKGVVELTVAPAVRSEFSVFLGVPAWSGRTLVEVNGEPGSGVPRAGEYHQVRRQWQAGDRVRLELDVTPRLTTANPLVRENVGRVAVERGPLVYALEQEDQPAGASLFDLSLASGGRARMDVPATSH